MTQQQIDKAKKINLRDFVIQDNFEYVNGSDHIKISCVFHDERTPSLAIYDEHFWCYSCGEKGDIIDWVKKIYKLEFNDAVTHLLGGKVEDKGEPIYREYN